MADAEGGAAEEKPKLRSWARKKSASVGRPSQHAVASSASSGGSLTPDSERRWVSRRRDSMKSLEDLASKYHDLKKKQEEEEGKIFWFSLRRKPHGDSIQTEILI